MYWTYITQRVLNEPLAVTSTTTTHKIIKNQVVRGNHSFDLLDKEVELTTKIRCQSAHNLDGGTTVSKYQRCHDISIELPMIRKRRLANILSNPNDYCQRQRTTKKGTLAGTILKKYKDIRLSNAGGDRVLQYSIQLDQMASKRSIHINPGQQAIQEMRRQSNGSNSSQIPVTISQNIPVTTHTKKDKFIIRSQLGRSVEFVKISSPRELQPLANLSSCSPRQPRPNSKHSPQVLSQSQNSLRTVNKVYGNLPKSIFKGK